uniref:non-specific serine/threonine protein kinase n=1 Tax=Oryza barthii TaxID=65489 RepID=A0A0D3EST7_9ORYZ
MLSLSGNQLSGMIPTQITSMNNLQELNLSNNTLSGTIPVEISGLTSLVKLHLANNQLVGPIPSTIGSLNQLQVVVLSQNSLSSTIPISLWHLQKLIELDLSHNSLSGSLPADIGKLTAITKMDLSRNQLSGDIPFSFGELQMMIYMNLSNNLLQGSIPDSVGKLLSIEELDLSSNVLSGVIPKSLANLTYLANLNLSFNRLEGQIPEGGAFSNITVKSLMGNKALCGLPSQGIESCQSKTHSRSIQRLLKFILPAVVAFFILAFCLCMLVRRKMNKQGKMPLSSDADLLNYQLISYHELVRATRNFSDDNLLGSGSFGKVFKGQLDDESIVAIKVLNKQQEVASKSFDTECRALRMARHRNLVRIVSSCSNLDFKALVLEYMPNGSLDNQLYSNDGLHLSFLQRLSIMLDVAMAMEYLHHHHFEVVLHFDLKPSNILLDNDMVAHVADFGISKLLFGDDNSITLTSMPGTVGYMAPEFGSTGKASRRSDVYSYGIVLLEVFTRKKPTDPMFVSELTFRQWINQAFPYELSNVTDCSLQQDGHTGTEDLSKLSEDSIIVNTCLASIIELGLLCSRDAPDDRVPMNEVVIRLNKIKSNYYSLCGSNGAHLKLN